MAIAGVILAVLHIAGDTLVNALSVLAIHIHGLYLLSLDTNSMRHFALNYSIKILTKGAPMSLFTIADLHLSTATDHPMDVFGSRWQSYTQKIEKLDFLIQSLYRYKVIV